MDEITDRTKFNLKPYLSSYNHNQLRPTKKQLKTFWREQWKDSVSWDDFYEACRDFSVPVDDNLINVEDRLRVHCGIVLEEDSEY